MVSLIVYDRYMDKKRKGIRYGPNRKLTDTQRLFVKNYTNVRDKDTFLKEGASYRAIGYSQLSSRSASSNAYIMKSKPHVKAAILKALQGVKITPEYQAKKLKELMESTKAIYHEGIKLEDAPDNEVRHKALVTSFRITEAIETLENSVNNVNISISPEFAERLVKIAAEMRAMREAHSGQVIPIIPIKAISGD